MSLWLQGRRFPPPGLARAVLRMRERLHRLADALVPAELVAAEKALGVATTLAIGVAARARLADALAGGPKSSAALATATGLNPDALERTLRALCSIGVFARLRDGRYRNTRISAALRSEVRGSISSFAQYMASASNLAAWSDFDQTVRTGQNAFERVHGTSVWNHFAQHDNERALFAAAMTSLTDLAAPALARAYPWHEVSKVCDVGGGRGHLLAAILAAHPHLRGVLVDEPGVIALARPFLEAAGVLGRVELVEGSFFEAVPRGADAYLLKDILHDWDDARSHTVLANCRAAMTAGGRVLVCEVLVEPETTTGPGPWADLQMMTVACEGRQRSRAELFALLGRSGFTPGRLFETAALTSIVEGLAR